MGALEKVPADAWVELSAGEVLFRQGEAAERVYFVDRGQLEAIREIDGSRVLRRYGAGDFLGEDAVLLGTGHRSTARATDDSRLLVVDTEALFGLLQDNPEIALRMVRGISRRLVELEDSPPPVPAAAQPAAGPAPTAESAVAPPGPADGSRDLSAEKPASSPPPAPAAPSPEPAAAVLVHEESGTRFEIGDGESWVIGRRDPATGESPDVDLETIDGNHSVSRRHARLRRSDQRLVLIEERPTANGTFVNGSQIETGHEVEVAEGDELQFGLVVLSVHQG